MTKIKENGLGLEGKKLCKSLDDPGRRRVVKTFASGTAVIAAYHVMPVKWGRPVIKHVFLPAHAASTGD